MKLTPEQEGFLKFCHDFMLPTGKHGLVYTDQRTQSAWSAWQCRGAWEPPASSEYLPKIEDKFREEARSRENANWQVVFKCHDGHDWGRLTRNGTTPLQVVRQWASQFCLANDLAGAHIERW